MSYIPTEKIHLSKNQVQSINTNEGMKNYRNLSSNINPNYLSPLKKMSIVYCSQYSQNLQMVNSPLNSNNKTLIYCPNRKYSSCYGISNLDLFHRNYSYNENSMNVGFWIE